MLGFFFLCFLSFLSCFFSFGVFDGLVLSSFLVFFPLLIVNPLLWALIESRVEMKSLGLPLAVRNRYATNCRVARPTRVAVRAWHVGLRQPVLRNLVTSASALREYQARY